MARVNLGRVIGRSAYEEAVRQGYVGTEQEWLASLKGENAYQLAVQEGYVGTEQEWLESLNGKTAYESAIEGGFIGTEQDFNASIASIGNLHDILDYINGDLGGDN